MADGRWPMAEFRSLAIGHWPSVIGHLPSAIAVPASHSHRRQAGNRAMAIKVAADAGGREIDEDGRIDQEDDDPPGHRPGIEPLLERADARDVRFPRVLAGRPQGG